MKRAGLLFCLACLLGCTFESAKVQTQVVRINIGIEPQSLDPRKARDGNAIAVVRMLFEGLTRIGKNGMVELALAQSIDRSEDNLSYTIRLKESNWSDGSLVTSHDFAYSWKSLLDPRFGSDLAYQLDPIKGAKAARLNEKTLDEVKIHTPDERTLIVELEEPNPYFLELLAFPAYFAVCQANDKTHVGWAEEAFFYISNGPFVLDSWRHGDSIEVRRNPLYWEAEKTQLARIELVMVRPDTEFRMFCDGKLDWAGSPLSSIPSDAVKTLKEKEVLRVSPLAGTAFLRCNVLAGSPLDSAQFRKALGAAIDRKQITEWILQGGQQPAYTLVPPAMGLKHQNVLGFYEDKKEPAVWKDAVLSVELLYAAEPRNQAVAQALQQQIEKALGISIRLVGIERKMFYERISQKRYELALGSWLADFNDPINFLEVFKYQNNGTNNTGWEHPKYVEWLNRSALCRTLDERKEALERAESLLLEDAPIIPLFHYVVNYVQSENLKEVALSPIGQIDFRWASLESKELR